MADEQLAPAAPPADDMVKAFDPNGQKVMIPAKFAQAAMQRNFRIASPDQIQTDQDEQQYGSGIGNALTAAAAGAGRTATFGLSDHFLTHVAGVEPHTLQALKTHQAFATAAGEVAGIGASALLAPELSPVGMLGRAGQVVAEGAQPVAEALTGSQIAAQTLSKAAGAALEGAGFSAGQAVSEKALGDDTALNADKLMAHVGMGAMFGGVLGGALHLGSAAVPKVVAAAQSAFDKFGLNLSGDEPGVIAKGLAKASSFVSGKPYEDILDAWKNRALSATTPQEQLALEKEFQSALGAQYGALKKATTETQGALPEALGENSPYKQALDNHAFDQAQVEKLFMKKALTRAGDDTFEVDPSKVSQFFSQINKLKGDQQVQVLGDWMQSSKNILSEMKNAYQDVPGKQLANESEIKTLLEKTGLVTDSAEKQAKYNKTMSGLGKSGGFMEGAGVLGFGLHNPALGAAYEGYTMLKNPGLGIQRLAKLNAMVSNVTDQVSTLSKAIFNPAAEVTKEFQGYLGAKIPHDTITKKVSDYSNNPEKLMDHLNKATEALYDAAPDHAGLLQTTAARGVAFLNTKVPRALGQKPLSPKYVPSKAEAEDFKQYYALVNNPLLSLEQVKTGMITTKAVEVLQNVYPKLYQDMQTQVTSELAGHLAQAKHLPYKTKMALSLFLNQDLDQSLTQPSIMSSQMAHQVAGIKNQASQMAQGGAQKPTQKGLSQIQASKNMLTPQQASAQREA